MLISAGDGGSPAHATKVLDLVGALAARLTSPVEQVLLGWLREHIALQGKLDYDGVAGWEHRSVFELVAAHGCWFNPVALPAQVRSLPERQCFANAAATEREHQHLTYVEGFALTAGSNSPTAHAWCTDGDGHAIDPTWSELVDSAYLGIQLPSSLRPHGPHRWGVLEAPATLFPLLRDGLPAGSPARTVGGGSGGRGPLASAGGRQADELNEALQPAEQGAARLLQ